MRRIYLFHRWLCLLCSVFGVWGVIAACRSISSRPLAPPPAPLPAPPHVHSPTRVCCTVPEEEASAADSASAAAAADAATSASEQVFSSAAAGDSTRTTPTLTAPHPFNATSTTSSAPGATTGGAFSFGAAATQPQSGSRSTSLTLDAYFLPGMLAAR
jgi:hypothetical protein